jgi:hypothetical protein
LSDLFAEGDRAIGRSRRHILDFVSREIELATTLLEVARTERSIGETEISVRSGHDAVAACGMARRFLAKVPELSTEGHQLLENELKRIEGEIHEFQSSNRSKSAS